MAKSKLRAALDAHKGVDYKQQKDKKKQKAGEKRSRAKIAAKSGSADSDAEDEEVEEGGVLIDEEAVGTEIDTTEEHKLQAELKALLGDKERLMAIDSGSEVDEDEDEEWESEGEEGSEDEEQGVCPIHC